MNYRPYTSSNGTPKPGTPVYLVLTTPDRPHALLLGRDYHVVGVVLLEVAEALVERAGGSFEEMARYEGGQRPAGWPDEMHARWIDAAWGRGRAV